MRHVRRFVDEMVRVGDAEIAGALALLMQRCKLAAEPSGAAGLAALVSGSVTAEVGSTVVIIVSGGNVGPDVLAQLL
jgi:threonine dehydratase